MGYDNQNPVSNSAIEGYLILDTGFNPEPEPENNTRPFRRYKFKGIPLGDYFFESTEPYAYPLRRDFSKYLEKAYEPQWDPGQRCYVSQTHYHDCTSYWSSPERVELHYRYYVEYYRDGAYWYTDVHRDWEFSFVFNGRSWMTVSKTGFTNSLYTFTRKGDWYITRPWYRLPYKFEKNHYEGPKPEWGELAQACLDRLPRNDINMISYVKEIPEFPEMFRSTLRAIKNLKNPKSWADLFLSTKYGWTMSYKDTADLVQMAEATYTSRRQDERIIRSRQNYTDGRNSYSAYYRIHLGTDEVTPAYQLRKVIDSGFWPTASNLWDLVPYSFVVNWLTGIDKIIEAIDNSVYLSLIPYKSVVFTLDSYEEVDVPAFAHGCCGELVRHLYRRNLRHVPHQPEFKFGDFSLEKHILESTALVVQKIF